jgi:DNA-binding FrmR family transcriptional regulator
VRVDEKVLGDVMRRLHRAEGQLRGAMAMLVSGRDCEEALTQLVAVSHAINGAGFVLIRDGLRQCARTPDPGSGAGDPEATAQLEKRLEKLFLSLA